MDNILNDSCSTEDLKVFEKKYNQELCDGSVSSITQFEYSCFLVRSRYPADIEKGMVLLEDLYKKPSETGKRDYVYYLALGSARLRKYQESMNYIKGLLRVEPENRQLLDLERVVRKAMEKDALKGAAVAGGAVLALGAIVGFGVALARRSKSQEKK